MMRTVFSAIILGALTFSPNSVCAQAQTQARASATIIDPAKATDTRISELPAILAGELAYDEFFAPSFLAAVPEEQLKALSEQLIVEHGQPLRILSVTPHGPSSATIKIEYQRSIATADISVEPASPHKVVGLLIKGFEVKGDSLAKVNAAFAALPGNAGYLVEKIRPDGIREHIAGRHVDQQFAIASTFKLYVLAELGAQVAAGQRKWTDIVPLSVNSYSSPATQNWPRNTPVTLQTLATWMISVSDNAATDALMGVLGREAIEKRLAMIGHRNPDKALPMLTTVEAFALKSNPALRKAYETGSESRQRALLSQETVELGFDRINMVALGSGPVAIDTIEWFASPHDIGTLMIHLRNIENDTVRDILSVNKGIAPSSAAKWQYLGYKGGSEPGVISMSFLAQSKSGEYYAITGSWNNAAASVDNAAFAALMTRLLDSFAAN